MGARDPVRNAAEPTPPSSMAGEPPARSHKLREDFSAHYILGRSPYNEGEFGDRCQDMVEAHRILRSAPGSP